MKYLIILLLLSIASHSYAEGSDYSKQRAKLDLEIKKLKEIKEKIDNDYYNKIEDQLEKTINEKFQLKSFEYNFLDIEIINRAKRLRAQIGQLGNRFELIRNTKYNDSDTFELFAIKSQASYAVKTLKEYISLSKNLEENYNLVCKHENLTRALDVTNPTKLFVPSRMMAPGLSTYQAFNATFNVSQNMSQVSDLNSINFSTNVEPWADNFKDENTEMYAALACAAFKFMTTDQPANGDQSVDNTSDNTRADKEEHEAGKNDGCTDSLSIFFGEMFNYKQAKKLYKKHREIRQLIDSMYATQLGSVNSLKAKHYNSVKSVCEKSMKEQLVPKIIINNTLSSAKKLRKSITSYLKNERPGIAHNFSNKLISEYFPFLKSNYVNEIFGDISQQAEAAQLINIFITNNLYPVFDNFKKSKSDNAKQKVLDKSLFLEVIHGNNSDKSLCDDLDNSYSMSKWSSLKINICKEIM